MADLYLVNLDVEAIAKLKDKAYEGKKLSVAVWVDKNAPEDWKKLSVSYGNKKKGEEVIRLGNASRAFISEEESLGF